MSTSIADRIDVAPFREAFERSDISLRTVAERCGWMRSATERGRTVRRGDDGRARRVLGMMPDHGGYQRQMTYEMAVRLCRAMDLEPVDMGV